MAAPRLVAVCTLVFGVLTVVVPSSADGRPTTYGAASTVALIADLTAGGSLLAAGSAVAVFRRRGSTGAIVAALGVVWLSADWGGWDRGWPVARSIAAVAVMFAPALLAHLSLAFPVGRVATRPLRLAVGVAYIAAGLPALTLALVRDPALDRYCWSNCSDSVFLVRSHPGLAHAATVASLVGAIATGVATAAWCASRIARATDPARPATDGVLAGVAVAALVEATYAVARLVDPAEDPTDPVFIVLFLLRAAALTGLAALVGGWALRAARRLAQISRLAERLGEAPPPGTLRAELARSLGDDSVEVAYWLSRPGRWAKADGRPVDPTPGSGRASTRIVRGGAPVALVIHDAELLGADDLSQRIGAAARLAVDNERLRAQLLARIDDVRTSRFRIVEAGDSTRRRLERDIHDGIQHQLLAAAYELRLAGEQAADPDLAAVVSRATDETLGTLGALRDMAHGIFPAILTDAGLAAALRTLAERAPIELDLVDLAVGRYPAAVETTAYTVVATAVEVSSNGAATRVRASVIAADGELVLRLNGCPDLDSVGDRVAALGGRIAVSDRDVEVHIPCG